MRRDLDATANTARQSVDCRRRDWWHDVTVAAYVKTGETLVILEAMKMEHSIKASEDGVISDIFIKENDQVENGAVLMVVDS